MFDSAEYQALVRQARDIHARYLAQSDQFEAKVADMRAEHAASRNARLAKMGRRTRAMVLRTEQLMADLRKDGLGVSEVVDKALARVRAEFGERW